MSTNPKSDFDIESQQSYPHYYNLAQNLTSYPESYQNKLSKSNSSSNCSSCSSCSNGSSIKSNSSCSSYDYNYNAQPFHKKLLLLPFIIWNHCVAHFKHISRNRYSNRIFSQIILLACVIYTMFFMFFQVQTYCGFSGNPLVRGTSVVGAAAPETTTPAVKGVYQPPILSGVIENTTPFSTNYGINLLKKNPEGYQFAWEHWVNLTEYSQWPATFNFSGLKPGPFSAPPHRSGTTAELRRIGQIFLKSFSAKPAKVLMLKSQKSWMLRPRPQQPGIVFRACSYIFAKIRHIWCTISRQHVEISSASMDSSGNVQYQDAVFEVLKAIEKDNLLPPHNAQVLSHKILDKVLIPLKSNDSFKFINDSHIHPTEHNLETEFHANFTSNTQETIAKSVKHFHELWLSHDTYLGLHYDWRFFRQLRREHDGRDSLHHLVHAWSAFTQSEGIVSWLAHGSLVGWYWNGLTLPWDADIDFQMPISELDRIARKYNNTLVVQDPEDGDGRYLIEVSPTYIERKRGNGNNVIDARFIDIRSGLYLDITGLAFNNDQAPQLVGCKSPHYYNIEHLYPLRLTTYEGALIYVPNDYEAVLADEYKNYKNATFASHVYQNRLRMWVEKQDSCEKYDNVDLQYSSTGELTYYGACESNEIWERYNLTQKLTQLHDDEMDFVGRIEQGANRKQQMFEQVKGLAGFAKSLRPLYPSPRYIEGNFEDV